MCIQSNHSDHLLAVAEAEGLDAVGVGVMADPDLFIAVARRDQSVLVAQDLQSTEKLATKVSFPGPTGGGGLQ